MVQSNLAAWTPDEKNPPYISINYRHSAFGAVDINIRERSSDGRTLGRCVSITLSVDEFQDILNQLKKNINSRNDEDRIQDAVDGFILRNI